MLLMAGAKRRNGMPRSTYQLQIFEKMENGGLSITTQLSG